MTEVVPHSVAVKSRRQSPTVAHRSSTDRRRAARSKAFSLANQSSIGTIGRQIPELCAGLLNPLADAVDLVGGQGVHDEDVAWLQRRRQDLIDVREKGVTIHRAIE